MIKYEMIITPTQLSSFDEIMKIGAFNAGYDFHLKNNESCRQAIFAPIGNAKEEKIILYYESEFQKIPGGSEIHDYFSTKGLEAIDAHPSFLIHAMAELTEEKLKALGCPLYVDIVSLTPEAFCFTNLKGNPALLRGYHYIPDEHHRREEKVLHRQLNVVGFHGQWNGSVAFLLKEKR